MRRTLASIGTIIAMIFAVIPRASAASGSGLSVSPPRAYLTINAGRADSIEVTLKNISGTDVNVKSIVNDFDSNNETGEPKINTDTSTKSPNSVRSFLVGVTDVLLNKDETKKISIPVQVPDNATSGAYYGVIRYTAEPLTRDDDGTKKQVALNASVGIIVLIEVPGNITEQVQAQKITAQRNDSSASFFVAPPNQSAITLKNTGNGFARPYGHVSVTKGGKEVYSYEMNNTDPRSNILPDKTRTFKDEIKNVDKLGRYTITANISYGQGGDILTLKTSFWVLPLWFIIAVLSGLLVALVAGYLLYKRISKRHHHHR